MDILFPVTELSPYAKVGGLADVAAALPKALRQLGHAITVVVPHYPGLDEHGLLLARRLSPLNVTIGDKTHAIAVYSTRLSSQVEAIFLDAPGLLDRSGVYGDASGDYPDNAQRFALFSKATALLALEWAETGKNVDIVHCHDWPTALVPFFVKEAFASKPELRAPKTVLTVHNAAYQGQFDKALLPQLGIDWSEFSVDGIEFYDKINFLKFGILRADAVTTVSETYAREIQHPPLGQSLEGVFKQRKGALTGIVNGVDYAVWNPAVDPHLVARYDAEDVTNKGRCKGALQNELQLPLDPAAPLIAFVGRLVAQKGADLIAAALPKLLRSTEAQFVFVGEGSDDIVSELAAAAAKSHGRAVFVRGAHEALAHRVFAAADFVLVPSRFEPCGLVQLYAQRYGSLPIVHATGGLADTVVDCDAQLETGTGFTFNEPSADALASAVQRAVAARSLVRWPALVRRVMRLDRGWERPARRYERLYLSLAPA
jgi:starch synthase